MWVSIIEEPIPTYGVRNGTEFLLTLHYQDYYGHRPSTYSEVVTAIWDADNKCFYELTTKKDIDNRDIESWWKNI